MMFPLEELEVIDQTMRMFTDPVLVGDIPAFVQVWKDERDKKRDLMADLNVTAEQLQSSEQFAALLRAVGVEPELKPGKNGDIYAFAKTDDFMRDLLDDEDDYVRGLAEARLGVKSSLLQTRAETLARMADRGSLCVYLYMYGAHTTRWSGGDATNLQNLPARKPEGRRLREAIKAPPGYKLIKPDLSQIECRLLNYLAGQHDVIDRFRRGVDDPYIGIASKFYNRNITRADTNERGVGKQAELSCGYGCGAVKFRRTAALGTYGPRVELSIVQSQRFVEIYRETHEAVVRYWRTAESILVKLANRETVKWGPMLVKDGCIWLPNGCPLHYETLQFHIDQDTGDRYWRVKRRHGWTKLYGAKLVENVVQALARVVIGRAMIRIARMGYRIVNTEHDSLWVLVPDDLSHGLHHTKIILNEMKRPPDWAPDLPLDAEA